MSGPLTVEVIEIRSGRGDYCEAWAHDADTEPTGDLMAIIEDDTRPMLVAAIAYALDQGAARVVLRPWPPEAVAPGWYA